MGAAQPIKNTSDNASPLSEFSAQWNDPKYAACNTAADAEYMNDEEKAVIYILNCARTDPKLFCSTVVKQYPEYTDNAELINITYYQSLITTLNSMKKQGLLQPDANCYSSAECHAYNIGVEGARGHDRGDSCRNNVFYNGECIDYGHADPLDIVMSLLIDYAVPSLGHRKICLGNYKTIGVSIQDHKTYDTNTVLDFHF
jgi:uncharacterized protein YkwD